MRRHHVESTSLRNVGYDPETGLLEVEFDGGAVYRYFQVPARVYIELMHAESMGTWFNQQFKPMGFDYQRVR